MRTLYILPGGFGLRSISPFCLKADALLRMAGLAFETKIGDRRKAPQGKFPYLDDGGQRIGGSHQILAHLEEAHGKDLDRHLDEEARALGTLAMRTAEEDLYWALVWLRWSSDAGWDRLRPTVETIAPGPLGKIVAPLVRRAVKKQLHAQGTGRYPAASICDKAARDVEALAVLLGDTPFLLGAQPSSYDAAVWAVLANLAKTPVDSPLVAAARDRPNLMAYIERMDEVTAEGEEAIAA